MHCGYWSVNKRRVINVFDKNTTSLSSIEPRPVAQRSATWFVLTVESVTLLIRLEIFYYVYTIVLRILKIISIYWLHSLSLNASNIGWCLYRKHIRVLVRFHLKYLREIFEKSIKPNNFKDILGQLYLCSVQNRKILENNKIL